MLDHRIFKLSTIVYIFFHFSWPTDSTILRRVGFCGTVFEIKSPLLSAFLNFFFAKHVQKWFKPYVTHQGAHLTTFLFKEPRLKSCMMLHDSQIKE